MGRPLGSRNKPADDPTRRDRTRGAFDGAVEVIEEVFKDMTEDPEGKLRPVVVICEADVIRIDRALAKLQKLRRVLFPQDDED